MKKITSFFSVLFLCCFFLTPAAYGQVSCTTTQANTSNVFANTTNNEVIGITVTVATVSFTVTSFNLATTGTTTPASNISNAKLWYTGTTNSFATGTQFGATVPAPNGAFTFSGSQALAPATYYFWLSYDVVASANVCASVIDATCNSVIATSTVTPTVTAPAGSRPIAGNMSFSSSTTTQSNTTTAGTATVNNEVIGIRVVTNGNLSALNATSFSLSTAGSTNPATDISNARIWYTGTSGTFATTTQFGTTVAAPNGTFTISGTQPLAGCATNYFWLTYDIPSGATINNVFDGECTSIIVGGTPYTPTVTAPPGSRTILNLDSPLPQVWGSYYGGSPTDYGSSCAVDANGNVYMAGATSASSTFIATAGAHQSTYGGGTEDCYLVKFNSAGVRLWATYYGGSGWDNAASCAVDANGDVYLLGSTNSTNGIASTGAHQTSYGGGGYPQYPTDNFLVKFNSAGVRQWGTYYGGGDDENESSIAIDGSNNVYIGGRTKAGSNGTSIATPGSHQATFPGGTYSSYLVKFNSSGVRQWGTYYGGGSEVITHSCAVDPAGNVYIAGRTTATANVVTAGAHQSTFGGATFDGFVAKFSSAGTRYWGTYYGGSGDDLIFSCRADSGSVYFVGRSSSTSGIASAGAHQTVKSTAEDAILVKFNNAGVRQWGTYYGGIGFDQSTGLAIDANGDVFFAGGTTSSSAMATAYTGIHQSAYGGGSMAGYGDAFLGKFNGSGIRQWVTYYGGTGEDGAGSCALDSTGNVFVIGSTSSSNGIATSGGHQPAFGGAYDGFLVKFNGAVLTAGVSSTNILCDGQCTGTANAIPSGGTGPYTYSWSGGQTSQNVTGLCAGTYTLTVTDATGGSAITTVTITQPPALSGIVSSQTNVLCNGQCTGAASIIASGGTPIYTYNWVPNGGTSANATGLCAGTYTCTITDANGCSIIQPVTFTEPAAIVANATSTDENCGSSNGTASVSASGGTGAFTYNWSPVGGATATATGLAAGNYSVTVTDANGCVQTATVTINNLNAPTVTLQSQTNVSCFGGNDGDATVNASGGAPSYSYLWSPAGGTNAAATLLSAGTYTCTVTDNAGCTQTQTVVITQPVALSSNLTSVNPSCATCCDGSITANVSGGTGPYSYQWSPSGSGQTNTGACTGCYTVLITDNNGCSSNDSACISFTTGLQPVNQDALSFIVYPNPSTENFIFEVSLLINESGFIHIYDAIGKEISGLILSGGENYLVVQTEKMSAGIYFYQLSVNGEIRVRDKLILNR